MVLVIALEFQTTHGKKYLHYKYNVILNYQNYGWKKEDSFWRYYCGTSSDRLRELMDIILAR